MVPVEMKQLIETLNKASYEYYQNNNHIMSDKKYDELYDRLQWLENNTGIVLSQSPTQNVGHKVVSALNKITHKTQMLSLDKTKEPEKLVQFLGDNTGILSWKLDGLTVVLNYENGRLRQAVTRGNGEIGEDITHNAECFKNIPLTINYRSELSVRGEAIITYKEFERINEAIPDENKYKNPRNLTSGTVRQLDSAEVLKRNVMFYAFSANGYNGDSKLDILNFLSDCGFDVSPYKIVDKSNVVQAVEGFKANVALNEFASDGLVLTFDNVAYSKSLGVTSKFPRDSIAFKWTDSLAETTLKNIEWNTSRTGLINPIAVFDAVSLEGTQVSRASIHNVSIMKELELGINDQITVYKANMIIPQLYDNLTRSNTLKPPELCPACGGRAQIKRLKEQEALYCENDNCIAKNISFLEHFVSRNAMNIEGLSASTLEKLVQKGFIQNYTDIYKLYSYYDEIKIMEGFGEKSVKKLDDAISSSKTTTLHNFIYALGISNVGLSNAKLLCSAFNYSLNDIINAESIQFESIKGFGEAIAGSLCEYFANPDNIVLINEMEKILTFNNPQQVYLNEAGKLNNKVIVITGDLNIYKNRNELKEKIESLGGKVTATVTGKTNYLINNDNFSNSTKNKKAKELGVAILSEEQFINEFFV